MKKLTAAVICAVMLLAMLTVCIPASAESGFYATAKLVEIAEHIEYDAGMNDYATVQGGCTDGTYAYFAAQQGNTTILKYDMRTWKRVDKATGMNVLGHANDMTYNSKRNWIVVANNAPEYNILTVINADSLEIVSTVTIKLEVYSIAYNPDRDIYVVGISGSYNFAFLDSTFKVVKKFKGQDTGYTRQGCDCDENYIYFAQSGGDNAVVVYDYAGKYVDIFSLGNSDEVENLFHVGSSFYTTLHHYGNFVHRMEFSQATQIRYTVRYDPGEGYGEMTPGSVHYGERTPLKTNTFKKTNYFFGGWKARRSCDGKYLGYRKFSRSSEWLDEKDVYEYFLYDDGEEVAETVRFGSVTMTPFWIRESYVVRYDSKGADGWMPEATVGYYKLYQIPENGFEMEGYIFAGFSAYRDYDNKYFGYRKKSKVAEWLEAEDLYKEYAFKPGEHFGSMTYDGTVYLSPIFRFAYSYNEDYTVLTEYIGLDELVHVPNPTGKLNTVATGAFSDNTICEELYFPDTVECMEDGAILNCTRLRRIYFRENFPDEFVTDCITLCNSPAVFVLYNGKPYLLGYAASSLDMQFIRFRAGSLLMTGVGS